MAAIRVDRTHAPFGLPETLAPLRARLDEAVLEAWLAIPAAAAMDASRVRPAHRVVDPLPSEHGSQRGKAAATR
jgi:hypothetical protein